MKPSRRMRRHAALTPMCKRLTPIEVAQLWFRRGADYAAEIPRTYLDFPRPGPDGLYLLTEIEAWFDRWHGRRQTSEASRSGEEDKALEIARHGRGHN